MNDRATHEPEGLGTLIARVYPDLQRIAAAKAAGSRCSPSSLAQETVCRLLKLPDPPMSEDGLKAVGYRLMEWTLLDRLRSDSSRRAREAAAADGTHADHEQRGGGAAGQTGLEGGVGAAGGAGGELERLSEALIALAEQSPRKAEVMTLSAVCGMTHEQIAAVLQVNAKTVQRDLAFARAWVASRLSLDEHPDRQRNRQR